MEYARYAPCPLEVQDQLIMDYQRSLGNVPDEKSADKKKKRNK